MKLNTAIHFLLMFGSLPGAAKGEWSPAWQPIVYPGYCAIERHHFLRGLREPSLEDAKDSTFEATSFAFHVFVGREVIPKVFEAAGAEAGETVFTVKLDKHPARDVAYNLSVAGHEAALMPGDPQGMYLISGAAAVSILDRLISGAATSLSVTGESDRETSLVIDGTLFDVSNEMFLACVASQTRNKHRQQGRANSAPLL